MDRYATHLQALVDSVLKTDGPILELGCGDYSTPVLTSLSRHLGRRLLVQAADEKWAAQFAGMCEVQLVAWEKWTPPPGPWSVVLLDSEEPIQKRLRRVRPLCDVADLVVLHDADMAIERYTADWKAYTSGLHSMVYKRYRPWTAVLSNGAK